MEETIQQGTVVQEKVTKVFINRENTVAVLYVNELKGHTGRTFQGILIAAGRTEAAVTTERNKFKVSAERAAIHGTTKRRIATADHLIDIFHLRFSGMKSIYNFFIMVCKDFL